ncbi:hypothetical protein [Longispora fulva]|uniref:Uncharacterized protein n=1 Tax=Longispora fulva TaxID=619741 RepID=A0A8J7GD23_9ACTN|nr:hypothetical protein [Longispora fulva]MBG6138318.1 hypothetical protein [Longispora fulva]
MTEDLVARSGDLKSELVTFSQRSRYDQAFHEALHRQGMELARASDEQLIMFVDYFVLQHRLRDGRTVVEEFVAARRDLTEQERDLLLGWREVVEGVFEVQARDGDALIMVNLIDDLRYRVRSNMGPAVFRQMPRRSFVITRLVPIGQEWLISGSTAVFRAGQRQQIERIAADLAVRQPGLVLRNPDKLAQAWELQRAERSRFIRFFGSDLVVLPGDQFADRMREYEEFSEREILAALAAQGTPPRPSVKPPAPVDYTAGLMDSETVAVIYDEVEGLNFYADFGLIEAAFADPALLRRRIYRERVLDYLDDESVSPLPFHRLADRDHSRASEVFRRLLRRPGFDWQRDGEQVMRDRKAWFYQQPPLPSITPISDRLAAVVSRS